MSAIVKLLGRDIPLECSAFSMVIYEDEFKRNFLRDYENIIGVDDIENNLSNALLGNYTRFAWAFAKTADINFLPFESFARQSSIADITSVVNTVVGLLNNSLSSYNGDGGTSKKEEAAE